MACPRAGIIWVLGGEERDDKVTESPREKPPMKENASKRGKIGEREGREFGIVPQVPEMG